MAHKRAAGSTRNGRDSRGKRLGVKHFGGEFVRAGNILVRQRGTSFHPGKNTRLGRDYTVYSLIDGRVRFVVCGRNRTRIDVEPVAVSA